jgi:hypothetical protein
MKRIALAAVAALLVGITVAACDSQPTASNTRPPVARHDDDSGGMGSGNRCTVSCPPSDSTHP